ncbi:FapA family protein [Mesobacillus subterraneus]|nr:FapA family protein [Mesobacillus subterraneus]
MGTEYKVVISKDRLSAELVLDLQQEGLSMTKSELVAVLKEEKVICGLKMDVLNQIAENPHSIQYPVVVAAGEPGKSGENAYLRNELDNKNFPDQKVFSFRSVVQIPSVRQGQLLATLIPAQNGIPGTDVLGNSIPVKPGRPLKVRAGNNVVFEAGKYYAACDGQVSITKSMIAVNPVFEVRGDLDLRTGNIDFVGNIVIKGNIPSGYEVKAGGDIWVDGLVEAASLHAEGNIVIKGGVAGALKGSLTAGGSVQANYLNQANVKASQDIIVKTSILHSKLTAGGNVDCKSGTIIGGMVSAGRDIQVKDLGNELFTKTELAVGWDPALEKAEIEMIKEIETAKANIKKLTEIEMKLAEIGRLAGKLTPEQQQLLGKQQTTRRKIESGLLEQMDELRLLHLEKQDRMNSCLFVYERVFPNTKVYFGKYALLTNQLYKNVKFLLDQSEISILPFVNSEKVHY